MGCMSIIFCLVPSSTKLDNINRKRLSRNVNYEFTGSPRSLFFRHFPGCLNHPLDDHIGDLGAVQARREVDGPLGPVVVALAEQPPRRLVEEEPHGDDEGVEHGTVPPDDAPVLADVGDHAASEAPYHPQDLQTRENDYCSDVSYGLVGFYTGNRIVSSLEKCVAFRKGKGGTVINSLLGGLNWLFYAAA